MQIVGRAYDDLTPFRVGAALERARPWLDAGERRPLQPLAAGDDLLADHRRS